MVFSNFEIGQFALASATAASNCSWLIPGIFAETIKCDSAISAFCRVEVYLHLVLISSAVKPAAFKTKLSFILKQPACAAATSSSGFVPTPSSKRELKEYCVLFNVVLCVVRCPLPSFPVAVPNGCCVTFHFFCFSCFVISVSLKPTTRFLSISIIGLLIILLCCIISFMAAD